MKILCKYAVVRFMPFTETQEFANVGVVLFVPKKGVFTFKLASTQFARVTNFYDDLDGVIYKNSLKYFREELERVEEVSKQFSSEGSSVFFEELVRKRESVISFSETSTILSDDYNNTLIDLYNLYVGRSFATKEYRETIMNKSLKQILNSKGNLKYIEKSLDADYLTVKLPLVTTIGKEIRVIKPLAFQQNNPLALIEHGEKWIYRLSRLIKAKCLVPEKILFAVEKPEKNSIAYTRAYHDVTSQMLDLGAKVEQFEDTKNIIKFAASDLTPESVEDNFRG
jgi:hypothetical protein